LAVVAVKKSARFLVVLGALFCLLTALVGLAEAKTRTEAAPTQRATKTTRSGKLHRAKSKRRGSWKKRGQKDIDDQRCRAIQEALIREKYLDGEPTGHWDDHSKAAMQKYQQDNGWQAKVVPDSRAIIKLGLGPSNEGLINPETAATAMSSTPALPVEKSSVEAAGRSGGSH
jgi:putative peptidoglycan binding protein